MTQSTDLLVALSTVLLGAVLERWEALLVDCQWRQHRLSATVTVCVEDPATS